MRLLFNAQCRCLFQLVSNFTPRLLALFNAHVFCFIILSTPWQALPMDLLNSYHLFVSNERMPSLFFPRYPSYLTFAVCSFSSLFYRLLRGDVHTVHVPLGLALFDCWH